MHELIDPLVRLEQPERARPESLPDLHEVDERLARKELRRQIAFMERELGALHSEAYPRLGLEFRVGGRGGPRLLGLVDLEKLRDSLAARIQNVSRSLREHGYVERKKRELRERMLEQPERYKWVRVSNEDIGEPGCRHWHSLPRLGPVGMALGWWRVKVSSGCP